MLYKKTPTPPVLKPVGWLRRLQENPEEEECHCNHRDGDESSFPSAEQRFAYPFPAEDQIEYEGKDGADQLHVDQRTNNQAQSSYCQHFPEFPDTIPGVAKDDAQHETDEKRYECHEQVIHEDIHGVVVHGGIHLISSFFFTHYKSNGGNWVDNELFIPCGVSTN